MALPPPPDGPADQGFRELAGFPEVIRSLFWRFYDHLSFLLPLNFLWIGSLWLLSLLVEKVIRPLPTGRPWLWEGCAVLVIGSLLSVGWSFMVFQAMNHGGVQWRWFWDGTRKFMPKGLVTACLFWAGMGWGVYDLFFLWQKAPTHPWIGFGLMSLVAWVMLCWVAIGLFLWPLLFFQDPPIPRLFYKAFLLAWDLGPQVPLYLAFVLSLAALFTVFWPLWFLGGAAFLFAFQCIALEKRLSKYRIFFEGIPPEDFLRRSQRERERNWRDLLRPWETK